MHPEREIEVNWSGELDTGFAADIVLKAHDRTGILKEITTVLGNDKVPVGDGLYVRHVMGDHQDAFPLTESLFPNQLQHAGFRIIIETGKRFIEQNQFGILH